MRPSSSPVTPSYPGYPPHSPYMRRVSPPGSPAPKKCCYEHRQQQQQQHLHQQQKDQSYHNHHHHHHHHRDNFFCCCYVCPGKSSASILATVGVFGLVIAYTILGAFTFMALEGTALHYGAASKIGDGSNNSGAGLSANSDGGQSAIAASSPSRTSRKRDATDVSVLRTQTVDRLWSITENLNILYRENWTKLAAEEVLEFQEALFRALKNPSLGYTTTNGGTMFYQRPTHRWSFSSSFLYSLTLITTIGYGSVSPRTSWGKLVTIVYALIGIPLMLLYLSTTGDVLARSFRRLYGKLCGIATAKKPPPPPQCPCARKIRVPVTLCLLLVLAYICSGALLFNKLENWSLLEGSYFCFTSLGTIGFGDLIPGQHAEEVSLCVCSAYILTGMALVAMCFSLVQDEIVNVLRIVGASCVKPELLMVARRHDDDQLAVGASNAATSAS